MSDLNDKPEVGFDHPRPSFLVALLNAGGKLDFLLRGQQRCLHDLSEVNLHARLRIVSHAPTSPQISSEATAGFDSCSRLQNTAQRSLRIAIRCNVAKNAKVSSKVQHAPGQ